MSKLDIYLASAGTGKLFPMGTKVYTPTGYKNIEDVNIGDDVLSYDNICKVTAKYHQEKASIYRITYSDGTSIEACSEHNWWVRNSTQSRNKRKWCVLTTSQILQKGLHRNYGNPKWEIPLCTPLQFNPQPIPIHPYTFGALLGDGYICKSNPVLTTMDNEVIERVLSEGYQIIRTTYGNSGRAYNYTLNIYIPKEWRHTSEDKYIPDVYKYNSTCIRFSVLQGLLDTDGCVDLSPYRNGSGNKSPSINYCTVSPQLAKDVMFLVQSLGGTATISKHRSLFNGKEYKPHYNVRIALPLLWEQRVFSIPRKRDRILNHTRRILPRRKIVDISYVGIKEGYCLTVDSEDSTYIVQDCIVTHNTHTLLDIIDGHLQEGVSIENIAFVTFTRKGAEVARLRTAEKFNLPLDRLKNFRTIHSLAFKGTAANRNMMMDFNKYKDFGEKAGYNFGTLGLDTTEGINWSEMKDQQLVAIEQLYRNNQEYCSRIMEDRVNYGDLVQYMKLYVQYKRTFGYKDFTDLLEEYIAQGLTEDVDIVCLDEMQDSSPLQWKLVMQAFKNAERIYAAGDIKQCQPGDELVLCRDVHWRQGLPQHLYYKRLDKLNPEIDTLVSMSRKRDGHEWHFTGGYEYQIEHHTYKGNIVRVDTGREAHRYTPEHRCLVRCFLDDSVIGQECVYLMGKEGNYKIGITRMTGTSSWRELGPLVRMREETADEMWVLKICNYEEALVYEMLYSYKYGIPQAILSRKDSRYEMYDIVYRQINTQARAAVLLRALGKDIRYPQFWRSDRMPQKLDTSYERSLNIGGIIQMYAMNLDPRFMDIVQYRKTNRNQKGCGYIPFAVTVEPYEGEVYSLNVESPSHTYINGELATHNCIFTYAGAQSDTLLRLRGEQHMLELSYRVPSSILDFAQHIVNQMQITDHSHCKSVHEGGKVEEINTLEELTSEFDTTKTYFFLARNKKFFKAYVEWCEENAIPYCVKGEPLFNATDKLEFREGKTETWTKEKLDKAQYYYSKGTFYLEPKVNISTIHTVKGDEADVVVLMSDISKAVASQLDVDEDSEHRVFYVAVTRAKEKLIIVQPQTKLFYPYLFM